MKYIYLLLLFLICMSAKVWSQEVSLGNSGGFSGWFRLGTLSLQQHGADAYVDIISGNGYNANVNQIGECHLHFRTSNGYNESSGVYASGSFYNTGRTKIVSSIRVIQINPSTWEFYAVLPSFTGQEAIFSLRSVSASWQSSFAKLDPPTSLAYLDLTEEFLVNNNSFFMDNVGIGTLTPKEKLSVNGKVRAHEVKVEITGWPDYVFEPEYELKTLPDVEKFIHENGHLPEIPAAAAIEVNGLSLGEMNKLLLKKIEELTLHLIEKDKEIQALRNDSEIEKNDTKVILNQLMMKFDEFEKKVDSKNKKKQ